MKYLTMFPLVEFKPILLSLVISLLVSFIFLGLTLQLSSRIFETILFVQLFTLYGLILFIPLPLDLYYTKLRVLLILGGSSSILYVIEAKSLQSKYFMFNSFWFSTLSVCLYLKKIEMAILLIFGYITICFIPIDLVFLSFFIVRSVSFDEWGFALFMQVSFLFWFKMCNVSDIFLIYLIYFLFIMVLALLITDESIMIAKYLLSPSSGALAIYFLYLARSGKEHLVTFMLFVSSGLLICFLLKKAEAAYYFLLLNLFLFLILANATYINLHVEKKRISEFPTELTNLVSSEKLQYLKTYYGVLLLMATFYSCEDGWMTRWTFSLLLQVGLIQFLGFFIKKLNREGR